MSNRAIGKRFEDRCKKFLESLGFTVDKARASLKFVGPGKFFSGANDIMGCADLVAVHPHKGYTLFVQCHHSTSSSRTRKEKLENVKWNLPAQKVQLWMPLEDLMAGIRTLELRPEGWKEYIWRMKKGEEPLNVL